MEPVKRKKSPLEQAYQSVADGFSGKKEVRHSYYEPIFVLDEEWNTLKQQEQESSESQEQIANQRAKRERVLARGFEASPYAKYKEHKEHKQADHKDYMKQWEALEEQLRTNPRLGLSYTFQVAQQRLFEETFCVLHKHTPLR